VLGSESGMERHVYPLTSTIKIQLACRARNWHHLIKM